MTKVDSTQRFLSKLGSKLLQRNIDLNAAFYLRQRLALSVQIGNSVCILETLPEPGPALFPEIMYM